MSPVSCKVGKREIVDYFVKNIPKSAKICDVGAGAGTYSDLLKPLGYTLDAVEVYEPYVAAYDLTQKYNTVFVGNVCDLSFPYYDVMIFGDVAEHLSFAEANRLFRRLILERQVGIMIVSVPYMLEQSAVDGNEFERHQQPDLTPEIFKKRYPYFDLFGICDAVIGVYIYVQNPHPLRWINQAAAAFKKGHYTRSRSLLEKCLRSGYRTPLVLNNLALTYYQLGQGPRAKTTIAEAVQLDPTFKDAQQHFDVLQKTGPPLQILAKLSE